MTLSRPRALLRLVLVVALVALAAPLAVASPAGAAPARSSDTKTVEGNWHPWNPNARLNSDDPDAFGDPYWEGAEQENVTPSVTVKHTTNLGDEVIDVSWRGFTPTSNLSNYAEPVDGGLPSENPFRRQTDDSAVYGVTLYQCRGLHPKLNPLRNDVYKEKADCFSASVFNPADSQFGVNNAQPSVTRRDGTGFAQFHVENRITNDLLRCSPTQPCSLVVVPNQGGAWNDGNQNDPDTSRCDDHSLDYIQAPFYSGYFATAGSDSSWCSWSKRIVVPLSFAPIAQACPATASSFNAAGSPALQRGLNQLLAGWCRGRKPVSFDYNSTSTEEEARTRFVTSASTGFTSDTDVALTSRPVDPSLAGGRSFAYAPVANNAVSIPYLVDNAVTGRPITDLRLSARLVAKLLTQSYSPKYWDCNSDEEPWCGKAVRGNPRSIFDDPEFARLNFRGDHPDRSYFPQASATGSQQDLGNFFPTVAGGDSDLTYTLTRWIANDPDASDFLHGKADPFPGGMRINKYYLVDKGKGSIYPTSQLQAQDPGYNALPVIPPKGSTKPDPRFWQGMQATWNPVSALSLVANTLVRNRSTAYNANGSCYASDGTVAACPATAILPIIFKRNDPEPNGLRELTGVTDNSEAQAYGLPTADLVTSSGSVVGPSRAAMASAAGALSTNADGVTQSLDFDSAPDDAYPLLLPVYAMVPTCGLTAAKAAGIKNMLAKVASSQSYGDTPGKLARGLLKLTSAQLSRTKRAATLVSTTRCPVPAGSSGGGQTPRTNGGGDPGGGTGGGSTGDINPAAGGPASNAPASAGPAPSTGPAASTLPKAATNVGYPLDDDGGGLSLLPLLLLLGALLLLGGPVAWWAMATAPGQTARERLRHLAVGDGWWWRK